MDVNAASFGVVPQTGGGSAGQDGFNMGGGQGGAGYGPAAYGPGYGKGYAPWMFHPMVNIVKGKGKGMKGGWYPNAKGKGKGYDGGNI